MFCDIDPPTNMFIGTIAGNGDKYYLPDDFSKTHLIKQNFSILQLNARSFNKNVDYLTLLLATLEHSFTVIAVCETLAPILSYKLLVIILYQLPVLVEEAELHYILKVIFPTLRIDDLCRSSTFESVFVEINNVKNRKCKLIVGCLYRPSGCELIQFNQVNYSSILWIHIVFTSDY